MPHFHDPILGKVTVSRTRSARYVRLGITSGGDIKVSAPFFTPMYFIRAFVKKSRSELQGVIDQYRTVYASNMKIGKSHELVIDYSAATTDVKYKKPSVLVRIRDDDDILDDDIQAAIREKVVKALRSEAKAYLPRRLQHIADSKDFQYTKVRFSHAKGRWGSCSSDGTISLNIALMKLPFELIDYVLIHELAHTKFLNHSASFWNLVEQFDPLYKTHRKALKNESPHI